MRDRTKATKSVSELVYAQGNSIYAEPSSKHLDTMVFTLEKIGIYSRNDVTQKRFFPTNEWFQNSRS